MDVAIVRTRVLAEAASHVWIAVSGTLAATTRHRVRQELRTRAGLGYHEFFLDLQELRCADGITADEVRAVFALGPTVSFHLIGAPGEIRAWLAEDPQITLHSGLVSAWKQWP